MPRKNLDYQCYTDAIRLQESHQEDWLRLGYAPRSFYLKDFCLLEVGDTFHLFHIAGTPGASCCLPGNETWFGHATTRDFRSWKTLQPCLYIDPGDWDGGHVYAPFVIEKDGRYWMFYTGCTIDNVQRIGAAVSDDLEHWQRLPENPLVRPEHYPWAFCPTSRGSACRDPHVCQWQDEYSLYYTAVTRDGKGCVARTSSRDLLHWQDCGPAYVYPGEPQCESSNVQELNGRYLLFFGGHIDDWSYVVSDNPFTWPKQEARALMRGVTAMEVVRRHDPLWLVAYFKFEAYRLFLGSIDWSATQPQIREIHDAAALRQFGF